MNNNLWRISPKRVQEKKGVFKVCKIYIKSDHSYIVLRFNNIFDFDTCGFGEYYGGKDFYFDDRDQVEAKLNQKITSKTKSIWFPYRVDL
tara:strand:- start:225 stop:494 length:270 start_codon:yes stop_codon:yes gene_type:complete